MENTAGSSSQQNYYQILGVSEKSSEEEIKTAYRKRLLKCHPDKAGSNPSNNAITQELVKARDTLIDSELRKKYDISLLSKPEPTTFSQSREEAGREADAEKAEGINFNFFFVEECHRSKEFHSRKFYSQTLKEGEFLQAGRVDLMKKGSGGGGKRRKAMC